MESPGLIRPTFVGTAAILGILAVIALMLAVRHERSSAGGLARPLPLTRRAGGWTHAAEHRRGMPHVHWTLTYRGEPVPRTGRLITPLGMLTNEPSRFGDTGAVLDVSLSARKVPEGPAAMTTDILTRGYHPSDCMTKPRGTPQDWCCRLDAEEAGWIAPSLLFGARFRVEDGEP